MKTDVKMVFTLANCQLVCSRLVNFAYASVRLLTRKISQRAFENLCSYCKNYNGIKTRGLMCSVLPNKWPCSTGSYSSFSRDVTAVMLVYRTIVKKVFWEFDSIIMQNLSDILPLFCTPTWPSHHVSENQEYHKKTLISTLLIRKSEAYNFCKSHFLKPFNKIIN